MNNNKIKINLSTKEENFEYLGYIKKNNLQTKIFYNDFNSLKFCKKYIVVIIIENNKIIIKKPIFEMIFLLNKITKFYYKTNYGSILFFIKTNKISIKLNFIEIQYKLFSEKKNEIKNECIKLKYKKER